MDLKKIKKPTLRKMNDEGFVDSAVQLAMVLITLVVIFGIAVMLGGAMDTAVAKNPAPADSLFNEANNPDLITGGDIWSDNAPYIGIIVMIFAFSVILIAIRGFRGNGA